MLHNTLFQDKKFKKNLEEGYRAIGLLIIDSSCTLQSFSRRLALQLAKYTLALSELATRIFTLARRHFV